MSKYKVIHLHYDLKFINQTQLFESDFIINNIVLIGDQIKADQFDIKARKYSPTQKDILKLIGDINSYDMVVFYSLTFINAFIANRIKSRKTVMVWRFFGHELYNKIPYNLFSNVTAGLLSKQKRSLYKKLKDKLLLHWQWGLINAKSEYGQAIKKIHFIIMIAQSEYDFFKKYIPELPDFIQAPYSQHKVNGTPEVLQKGKRNQIIVGHSRSPAINHLDILTKINSDTRDKSNTEFLLFFSYGGENEYTKEIKRIVSCNPYFHLIENFLTLKDFENIYRESSAFVLNSYRQLAGANIMTALKSGLKVYLNPKNPMYQWYIDEGFIIEDINCFFNDLNNKNTTLSVEQIDANLRAIYSINKKYSQEKFLNTIKMKLDKKL